MPRYIDEDGLKKSMWEYTDKYGHIEMTITFFNILLERNRVDAIPVVRCKDCKWRNGIRCYHKRSGMDDLVGENDYCSWGERRKDAVNEN